MVKHETPDRWPALLTLLNQSTHSTNPQDRQVCSLNSKAQCKDVTLPVSLLLVMLAYLLILPLFPLSVNFPALFKYIWCSVLYPVIWYEFRDCWLFFLGGSSAAEQSGGVQSRALQATLPATSAAVWHCAAGPEQPHCPLLLHPNLDCHHSLHRLRGDGECTSVTVPVGK